MSPRIFPSYYRLRYLNIFIDPSVSRIDLLIRYSDQVCETSPNTLMPTKPRLQCTDSLQAFRFTKSSIDFILYAYLISSNRNRSLLSFHSVFVSTFFSAVLSSCIVTFLRSELYRTVPLRYLSVLNSLFCHFF